MAKTEKKFVTAAQFLAQFSTDECVAIDARARQLVAEELTLRDLRKALELTQTQLSTALGIGQEQVSRLEQRSDLLLSTLASYIDAMGGKLRIMVEFPDRPPVALRQIGDAAARNATRRPRAKGTINRRG